MHRQIFKSTPLLTAIALRSVPVGRVRLRPVLLRALLRDRVIHAPAQLPVLPAALRAGRNHLPLPGRHPRILRPQEAAGARAPPHGHRALVRAPPRGEHRLLPGEPRGHGPLAGLRNWRRQQVPLLPAREGALRHIHGALPGADGRVPSGTAAGTAVPVRHGRRRRVDKLPCGVYGDDGGLAVFVEVYRVIERRIKTRVASSWQIGTSRPP